MFNRSFSDRHTITLLGIQSVMDGDSRLGLEGRSGVECTDGKLALVGPGLTSISLASRRSAVTIER